MQTAWLDEVRPLPLVVRAVRADVDLLDWIATNRGWLDQQLLAFGGVLLSFDGVASLGGFRRVARQLCGELTHDYGDLPREEEVQGVYKATPYPAHMPILFHNEASHTHAWPQRIAFFCLQAAERGGETVIADGREVLRRLEPDVRRRFERRGLRYLRNFVECFDVSWQSFFGSDDPRAVERRCVEAGVDFVWTPAGLRTDWPSQAVARHPQTGELVWFNQIELHHISRLADRVRRSLVRLFDPQDLPRNVTFGDGGVIDDVLVDDVARAYRSASVRVPLRQGDILLLDNMLVAHGREPFVGERRVAVAMGQLTRATDAATTGLAAVS